MKDNTLFLKFMEKNGCNEIHIKNDVKSGCVFVATMNSEYADKGNGGTRMMNYPTFIDGIEDATKLIDVMTKKCVIVGKKYNGGYSGGKGIIMGNPKTQKTPDMLRRYGRFIQSLNGRLQTGTDMNINLKDIEYMAETSKFIDGLASGLGDTAIPTALGIYIAMKVMCKHRYGNDNLKNRTIAIQGVGSVGNDLVRRLTKDGAKIIIADINSRAVVKIKKRYGVKSVKPNEIFKVKCDIFSPNACGGILTDKTVNQMNCDMIIGAANNPLSNGLETVLKLDKKKITYVPDYVINIGGVFLSMCEVQGKSFDYVIKKTQEIIKTRLKQIIDKSKKDKKTLYEAAEDIVNRELERSK